MEMAGQRNSPAALPLPPPGKTQYQLYRRVGKPQDRSGRLRKMSPPPGFDPRTSQLVASRYIDYAIHLKTKINRNCLQRLTSNRAVNTILFGYKNHSVHAVWGNIAVYSESRTEHINTLCGQNVDILSVKPNGTSEWRRSHWTLDDLINP